MCEIKLFQIGDSDIASSFTAVERPNDWTKEIKKTTATNPTQQQRLEYWQAFNDYVFQNAEFNKAFNKRKPTTDNWMDFSIGSSACHIAVSQIQKRNAIDVDTSGNMAGTRIISLNKVICRIRDQIKEKYQDAVAVDILSYNTFPSWVYGKQKEYQSYGICAGWRLLHSGFLHPEGVFSASAKSIIIKPEHIDVFADDMVYYVID